MLKEERTTQSYERRGASLGLRFGESDHRDAAGVRVSEAAWGVEAVLLACGTAAFKQDKRTRKRR